MVSISNKYGLENRVEELRSRMSEISLSIAFLGEFSSGKSSLVNSLIGKKVLPVFDEPTTATIVEVVGGEKLKAFVEYDDKDELVEVNISEVGEYITNPSKISKVVIEVPENEVLKKGFKYIDTPGIQSLDQTHEDITFGYLPKVDAAVLVMDINYGGATESIIKFLKDKLIDEESLNKFIFVLNKADTKPDKDIEKVVENLKQQLNDIIPNPVVIALSAKESLDDKEKGGLDKFIEAVNETIIKKKERLIKERYYKELCKKGKELSDNLKYLLDSIKDPVEDINIKINKANEELEKIKDSMEKVKREFKNFKEGLSQDIREIVSSKINEIIKYSLKEEDYIASESELLSEMLLSKFEMRFDTMKRNIKFEEKTKEGDMLLEQDAIKEKIMNEIDLQFKGVKEAITQISRIISSIALAKVAPIKAGASAAEIAGNYIISIFADKSKKDSSDKTENSSGWKEKIKKTGKAIYHIVNLFDIPEKVLRKGVEFYEKGFEKDKLKKKLIEKLSLVTDRVIHKVEVNVYDYINNLYDTMEDKRKIIETLSKEKKARIVDVKNKMENTKKDIDMLNKHMNECCH